MPRSYFVCVTVAVAVLAACAKAPPPPKPREPVGILYVAVPELTLHESPNSKSPVVATYREGESVTVYSTRGEWAEVQLVEDRTAWVRRNDLTAYREDRSGTTTPRFRRLPSPVWSQRKVKGEIVLEASVDEEGNVTAVRTVSNTTEDASLEAQNRRELLNSKFHPLLMSGRPQPFLYEYRVTY
jgi:uncharacterized protein YgiM (DUF1202 family)